MTSLVSFKHFPSDITDIYPSLACYGGGVGSNGRGDANLCKTGVAYHDDTPCPFFHNS